jgi:hypothetical protein
VTGGGVVVDEEPPPPPHAVRISALRITRSFFIYPPEVCLHVIILSSSGI